MTTINKAEIQKFSNLAEEWWDVTGKRRRQGKPYRNRKSYVTKDKKHTIPKKKKKINRTTKFEGAK